ncbi:MAG TPA: hypothetical protein DCO75_12355 [Fibrobacteres bacterium]|jgi:superfamily I DNA/RNA helicase|nr:hypothetical protein [Fibrobacterota bacterium]
MVIAGPGTGKTHTLASRMAYLVTESGISPCSMTAVTFTNKAASEMQKRLSGLLKNSNPADMPHIGTFHNICLDLLRIISPEKSFTIIDQASATAIIKDIIGGANIKASDTMRKISLAKASGRAGIAAIDPQIQSIYSEYTSRLEQFDAMDFDDILLKTSQALENNQLYEKISGRFQYILVDEFQDINNIQYSLVKLWTKAHGNIFVIGDPHQAIYGFRGASPAYFKTFGHDFPNVKIITLNRNYRSPAAVVNAAASVISQSADARHYPLSMRVESKNNKPVRFVETRNEFFEALFIAKEINRMAGGMDMLDTQSFLDSRPAGKMGSYGFSDMAVLYRTHKQADIIEQCLLKEGIPYRVAGREDFLNDDVVRHAMAFFKFILNPDDISSLSLCCNKCIKNDSLEIVRRYGAGLHNIEALENIANCYMLPSDDSLALVSFINTAKKYSKNLYSQNPQTLVCSWAEEYKAAQHPGILRLSAISELYPDIKSLVFNITMGQDADIVRNGLKTPAPDAVLLTTLHAAKGLEFPVVFLCGVNEGIIPLHNYFTKETDIEEERRLFYVGITRAKDELVCTMSRKRTIMGSTTISSQSCFVKEMDEKKLLKEKFGLEQNVKQMSFL